MIKITKITTILFIFCFLASAFLIAYPVNADSGYYTLAPIPGYINTVESTTDLNGYLNAMFKLGIAVAVGLAVVMIIFGGIQYMSSDALAKKSDGKSRITAAVVGLLVALGSYMILNTLDPKLLSTELVLDGVRGGEVPGEREPAPRGIGSNEDGKVRGPGAEPSTPSNVPENITEAGKNQPPPGQGCNADYNDQQQGPSPTDTNGWANVRATHFGYQDEYSQGHTGSPLVSPNPNRGINNNDPNIMGVALNYDTLKKALGVNSFSYSDWQKIRDAGVEVSNGKTSYIVHVTDTHHYRDNRIDETYKLNQLLGGDTRNRYFRIIPDYYKNTNPECK